MDDENIDFFDKTVLEKLSIVSNLLDSQINDILPYEIASLKNRSLELQSSDKTKDKFELMFSIKELNLRRMFYIETKKTYEEICKLLINIKSGVDRFGKNSFIITAAEELIDSLNFRLDSDYRLLRESIKEKKK